MIKYKTRDWNGNSNTKSKPDNTKTLKWQKKKKIANFLTKCG